MLNAIIIVNVMEQNLKKGRKKQRKKDVIVIAIHRILSPLLSQNGCLRLGINKRSRWCQCQNSTIRAPSAQWRCLFIIQEVHFNRIQALNRGLWTLVTPIHKFWIAITGLRTKWTCINQWITFNMLLCTFVNGQS